MGVHGLTSDLQKVAFLVYLEYLHQVEAARRAGLPNQTATDLKNRVQNSKSNAEKLVSPLRRREIATKPGTGAELKIIEEEITGLLEACTLNKKQRKELWHIVVHDEGFFDLHRRTIEKKLRERGLRRAKSTKKLGLIDIRKAQHYKVAPSQ